MSSSIFIDPQRAECLYQSLLQTWHEADGFEPVRANELRTAAVEGLVELHRVTLNRGSLCYNRPYLATLRLQAATWYLSLSDSDSASQWAAITWHNDKGEDRQPAIERIEPIESRLYSDWLCDRNGYFANPSRWRGDGHTKYCDSFLPGMDSYGMHLIHWFNEIEEELEMGGHHRKECCPACGSLDLVSLTDIRSKRRWSLGLYGRIRCHLDPTDERWWPYDGAIEREERELAAILAKSSEEQRHRKHYDWFGPRFAARICFAEQMTEARERVHLCRHCKKYFGRYPSGDPMPTKLSKFKLKTPDDHKFITDYPRPKEWLWGNCPSCCREIIQSIRNPPEPAGGGYCTVKVNCESCGCEAGIARFQSNFWFRRERSKCAERTSSSAAAPIWKKLIEKVAILSKTLLLALLGFRLRRLGLAIIAVGGLVWAAWMLERGATEQNLLMRPFQHLVPELTSIESVVLRNPESMSEYAVFFWAGHAEDERRADLRRLVSRIFTVYPELGSVHIECAEFWRRNEKGKREPISNYFFWTETFERPDPALDNQPAK